MERRDFGRTGMQVGVLGFGAGEIGSENTPYVTVDKLLGEAADAGLNVIDTAPLYSDSKRRLAGPCAAGVINSCFLRSAEGSCHARAVGQDFGCERRTSIDAGRTKPIRRSFNLPTGIHACWHGILSKVCGD